jgi:hypothetical protein
LVMKDGFLLVRADRAETSGQPDVGMVQDRMIVSPRMLKSAILGATAAAIVFAIVLVENPVALLADAKLFTDARFLTSAKAFLIGSPAPEDGSREDVPIVQSTAEAQASPPMPTASDAPTEKDIAAPLQTAEQSQTEIRQTPTESLLGQFQAWAASQDARAEVRPVEPVQAAEAPPVETPPVQPPPVQTAQADPAQEARAEASSAEKQRPVRPAKNARAETRAKESHRQNHRAQNHRPNVRRVQNAQAQVRSAQDARAQEPPVQNARTPTFLESLGFRDSGNFTNRLAN